MLQKDFVIAISKSDMLDDELKEAIEKELPKNIPIYIYCRSGRRAEEAENILLGLKFDKALAIGGIIEWQERGGILIK
jgi:rhodanese-related sulfurtransferase